MTIVEPKADGKEEEGVYGDGRGLGKGRSGLMGMEEGWERGWGSVGKEEGTEGNGRGFCRRRRVLKGMGEGWAGGVGWCRGLGSVLKEVVKGWEGSKGKMRAKI